MNAAVQCLSRVGQLTRYLLSGNLPRNRRNPLGSGCAVLDAYCELLGQMASGRGSVSPDRLKRAMGSHNSLFAGHGQHDSTEFCTSLLDAIHEDLNQSLTAQGHNGDLERFSGMELHRMCNQSKVVELFHGETCTEYRYSCGYRELISEPLVFWALSLPPGGSSLTLDDCIRFWQKEQRLTGDNAMWCDRCQCEESVTRKAQVARFAPVLVIQLKRFSQGYGGLTKNETRLSYPLRFEASRYSQRSSGTYELTGVICHAGTLSGGHYTALVRDGSQWYDISDSSVTRVAGDWGGQRSDSSAMALFYQCTR